MRSSLGGSFVRDEILSGNEPLYWLGFRLTGGGRRGGWFGSIINGRSTEEMVQGLEVYGGRSWRSIGVPGSALSAVKMNRTRWLSHVCRTIDRGVRGRRKNGGKKKEESEAELTILVTDVHD